MQQRPCPAKITIFSPVDHSLRRAVVIPAPGIPHNHPFCPWDKRTRRARAAARAAGVMNQTSCNAGRRMGSFIFRIASTNVSYSITFPDGR